MVDSSTRETIKVSSNRISILFSDSSEDQKLSDNFVVCTSSADCYPISPSILISILGGFGENLPTSASENDVNIDIPQRRGISGSYLFRSKKADGEKEKKSNRRGGYLFRTKKMGRYTRGKQFLSETFTQSHFHEIFMKFFML
jgi:hypothetical protein